MAGDTVPMGAIPRGRVQEKSTLQKYWAGVTLIRCLVPSIGMCRSASHLLALIHQNTAVVHLRGSHEHRSDTLYSQFHIYSIKWTPGNITWYFDNIQYATLDIRDSQFDEFREPFFILLNFAVGGQGGAPVSSAYPQQMAIDWVRHYCPADASGQCITLTLSPPSPTTPPSTSACPEGAIHKVYGDCTINGGSQISNLQQEEATDGGLTAVGNTSNGARGSANSLKVTRSGGSYGGAGWKKTSGTDDLSARGNLHFSYRLPTGASHRFFVKVESGSSACNEHSLSGLVADGAWHDVSVPTSALFGASNGGPCSSAPVQTSINVPFYVFLTGNGSVDIDEVYYD